MKILRRGILFAILPALVAGAVAAQGESLNDKLQREIVERMVEFNNAGKSDQLVGERFVVRPLPGMRIHNIEILPKDAFSEPIRQNDGSLEIQIVNAVPLFISKAGTKTPARIRVIISTMSEGQGDIILDGNSACINTLSYRQVGNDEQIQIGDLMTDGDYEVNWQYTEGVLEQGEIRGNQITFTRIDKGPASVVLVVRSKLTGKTQTVRHDIPECLFAEDTPVPTSAPVALAPPEPPAPRRTWLGVELGIGYTGRFALDMVRDSGGPIFKFGLFTDYHITQLDTAPDNNKSSLSYGLRVGAGWRFGKNTVLSQFPVALTNRGNARRFGGEVGYARELKSYVDVQLTAGATVVENSDLHFLVVAGAVLHLGRPKASSSVLAP